VAELETALRSVNTLKILRAQIVVVDLSKTALKQVRPWLDDLQGGLTVSGAFSTLGGQSPTLSAAFSLRGLLDLVPGDSEGQVRLSTAVHLVSGEKTVFKSGSTFEREVFDAVASSAQGGLNSPTFRRAFDRVDLGLTLNLDPRRVEGGWMVSVDLQNKTLESPDGKSFGQLNFSGSVFLQDGNRRPVQLASLTKADDSKQKKTMKLFSFLSRDTETKATREVLVFIQPL